MAIGDAEKRLVVVWSRVSHSGQAQYATTSTGQNKRKVCVGVKIGVGVAAP